MSSYLIVDGYNLIHAFPNLSGALNKSAETARVKLYRLIQGYCDCIGSHGIIVYDGKGTSRTVEEGDPTVIFSSKRETADTVIEALVSTLMAKGNSVSVSTNDRAQSNMAFGMGASVLSSRNLSLNIKAAVLDRKYMI